MIPETPLMPRVYLIVVMYTLVLPKAVLKLVMELGNTQIIGNIRYYYARLYREVVEIHKRVWNFNKKAETIRINKVWLPVPRNTTTNYE